MRSLIIALFLLLPTLAYGQNCSFANPAACGSPGVNNLAVGGTLNVTGTATASGLLNVTGAATFTSTAAIGTGQTNSWLCEGSSGSPDCHVVGSGNQFAVIKGLGTFGPLLQTPHGNVLTTEDNNGGSVSNSMTMLAPGGSAGQSFNISVSDNTGGLKVLSPFDIQYNWTYSGVTTGSFFNHGFEVNNAITGTSADQSQYAINSINQTFTGFQSGNTPSALGIGQVEAAGSTIHSMVPLFVTTSQSGPPAAPTAWGTGQSITTAGTLRSNGGILYQATNTGTTGASAPTCGIGSTCSDGTVTWLADDTLANANYSVVIAQQSNMSYNAGGASTAPIGSNFGANFAASLLCPGGAPHCATFYTQNVGVEIDDIIQTGASSYRDAAVQLVKEGQQGLNQDWGISFAGTGVKSWLNPIIFQAAIDPNGIGIAVSNQGGGAGGNTMAGFIDCLLCQATGQVTGAGGTLNAGGGGYIVRSQLSEWLYSGDLELGNALFHIGTQSLTLDTGLYTLTAVGAADGTGANWPASSTGSDDQGNIFTVAASAGVPTGATILYKVPMASCPAGAQAIHSISVNGSALGTTGSALKPSNFNVGSETCQQGTTLNIGNTTATTIGIGNSGSTTTINGTIKAGSGTGQSQTCTVNQAKTLIFTNGILTGGTCNS